jgi:hypothetical protein
MLFKRAHTCESVQRSDWQLHIDKHEILTETVQSDTRINCGKERHRGALVWVSGVQFMSSHNLTLGLYPEASYGSLRLSVAP